MSRAIAQPVAARKGGADIRIVDDTWVGVRPSAVAAVVADERNFRMWWPHLHACACVDRGVKGRRWEVDGQIVGILGIWLEPFWDGTILHHYVRGDRGPGAPRDVGTRHTLRWKRSVLALKDRLEAAAGPGL